MSLFLSQVYFQTSGHEWYKNFEGLSDIGKFFGSYDVNRNMLRIGRSFSLFIQNRAFWLIWTRPDLIFIE